MKENNDTNLNNSHTNNSIPSPEELRRLFSSVGVESTLDRIGVYLFYRFINLWIYNHNPCEDYDYEKKLQKYTTELISKFCDPHLLSHRNIRVIWDSMYKFTLYKSIAHININTFFNTYYSNYLGYVNPMVYLNSFYKRNKPDQMSSSDLLILFHYLLVIRENHETESVYSLYLRLSVYTKPFFPDYRTFCRMWTELFVIPKISKDFSQYYYSTVADALHRLGMNTTYRKSLIILYSVLYHDHRQSEKADILVEKLRDGNDLPEFKSAQAIFTYKNKDNNKPRFLNILFESTVPTGFRYELPNNKEAWKVDLSTVIKFFGRCLLDLSLNLLIPEAFPSNAAVIAYLGQYPGRDGHSTDRRVIEVICAYLYSLESTDNDKVAVFKSFLEKTLQRDGLSNYEEIYEHLDKLHTSYAMMQYYGEERYKNIISDARLVLTTSATQSDKDLLKQYLTTTKKKIKSARKLNNTPALNFLMETQNNSCLVEDSLLFEEAANYVLQSSLYSVVLLQPSYTFLLKWLSDYRTKNRKTTVVIYDERIVQCMNEKLKHDNLISKELFYRNQKTILNLQIISSVESIRGFDYAIAFYNKNEPKCDDIIVLSHLLTADNRMRCVLPQRFFEEDAFESTRGELLSTASINRVTYVNTNLFTFNPKKKLIVDFYGKAEYQYDQTIKLRFIEINKELQKASGNLVKSDLGLYYIDPPEEAILKLDCPYDGKSINFKDVYRNQNKSATKEKQKRDKARELRLASDFIIRYTVTNHGGSRQAKCYFSKYIKPSKATRRKKDYGEKIKDSQVTLSAPDDEALEKKIIEEFPSSKKFEKFRTKAAEEVRSAYEKGILGNLSLFSFTFAFSEEIINSFYVDSFDQEFCYRVLCGTSLGSLILNEATQGDFEKSIAELEAGIMLNSYKLLDQLGKILDIAVRRAVLFDSMSPIFLYLEKRKKLLLTKSRMRDAFTLKTFSQEQEKRLIEWLLRRIPKEPVFLGTMIKLFTGMSTPEVCMLTWGDFCKTPKCNYYHFNVTKQMDWKKGKDTVKKGLTSNFKYRLVPIPEYLAELILAHKQRYMKEFGILSDEELNDYPLILPNYKGKQVKTAGKVRKIPVYCTVNKLRLNSQTAKEDGAEIPEEIISFEGADGTEEHDFANYIGDFYGSNFKYHALSDAMMTRGQVSYMLGLTPADTFTRHYCDYKNSSLQMMLVEKLNDWCAIYKAWEYKPVQVSGTILKRLSKTLYPFTADCTSGQLRLKIDHQLQSDIEITIASDRGIRGTITVYKEESNGKRGLLSSDP